jgi:hypothetical protein
MALDVRWSATLPGDAHHLLAIDPAGMHIYAGDGWGVAYASLSLRLIDISDGRELKRLRTRHQQPRSITYRGPDLLLATDSRLFQVSRTDLAVRSAWDRGVPRFADVLELESDQLLMTNWLRPTAGIFDLASGRPARWLLEAGLRPLRWQNHLTIYSLRSGLLRSVDLATRSSEIIFRGAAGLSVALAADRWLAILAAPWKPVRGGVEEPLRATRELVVYDLTTGTASKKTLSRDTLAVEAANNSPILWLLQRGPGARVLPSIIERVDAPSCQTVDTIAAPTGSDVVRVAADQSVVFFGQPQYREHKAVISFGIVT